MDLTLLDDTNTIVNEVEIAVSTKMVTLLLTGKRFVTMQLQNLKQEVFVNAILCYCDNKEILVLNIYLILIAHLLKEAVTIQIKI